MNRLPKIIAVVVLVAVAASLSPAQGMVLPATSHPAGCHSHRPQGPSRAPVNHQCCVSGHEAAMPTAGFSCAIQLSASDGVQKTLPVSSASKVSAPSVFLADSPPGSAPLRI